MFCISILFIILLRYQTIMGAVSSLCGDNIFKQLQTQYGDQFMKLVLAEKAKDTVNSKFGEFTQQSQQIFSGFETKAGNIVSDKSSALKGIFEDVKSKVESVVPGGIPAFEKLKGQSINEVSGYNSLQGQIEQIKTDTFNKINTQKANVINQITIKKGGMINSIDAQRPKVPLYQDLPQPVKTAILHEGETVFADQISQNKDAILGQVAGQFNPANLGGIFGQLSPEGILQNLVGGAAGQFLNKLGLGSIGNLIGGGAGGLGNLIGGGSGGLGGLANVAGNLFR